MNNGYDEGEYRSLKVTIEFGGTSDEEVLTLARKQLDPLNEFVKQHAHYQWDVRPQLIGDLFDTND